MTLTSLFKLPARFRDLLKHSAIYSVGNMAARAISIVLLPVYTRYLSPTDYGYMALLDLSSVVFSLVVGGGIANAVTRFHFDDEDPEARRVLWWTGLSIVGVGSLLVVTPAWLARDGLARLVLGPEVERGGLFFALLLPTIALNLINEILLRFVQIRKWSTLFVGLTVSRLLLNAGLNLFFLIAREMGVAGILLGNLLSAGATCVFLLTLLWFSAGRYAVRPHLLRELLPFGLPFVGIGLLSMVMHQIDRYLLRVLVDFESVGLYSVAYALGQGSYDIVTAGFGAIWGVSMYEIAARPDRGREFSVIHKVFCFGLALVLFGVSLFSDAIVQLLTAPDFHNAARFVPIVCLAYFFFAQNAHFPIPAILAKNSRILLPAALAGAVINVVCNLFLIPRIGAAGAAWASVLTFAVFSFGGLYLYRKIDRYPYQLGTVLAVVAGMVASFLFADWLPLEGYLDLAARFTIWLAWAVPLALTVVSRGPSAPEPESSPSSPGTGSL